MVNLKQNEKTQSDSVANPTVIELSIYYGTKVETIVRDNIVTRIL